MANWKLRGLRDGQRRRFLKLMGLAAAGVGLERSGFLNFLAEQGGHDLADAAAGAGLFLAVPGPNGSEAWFQSMWPALPTACKAAGSGLNTPANQDQCVGSLSNTQSLTKLPWLYTTDHGYGSSSPSVASMSYGRPQGDPGVLYVSPNGGRKFVYGPDAAFFDFAAGQPTYEVTALMSGFDETHTLLPLGSNILSGNNYVSAAIAAIQAAALSALVPVIGVDPVAYDSLAGTKGAPEIATVPSGQGIIDLFNSAASRFTVAELEDQQLFETYYNAVVALRRAAPRSTWQPNLKVAKGAAKLIGLNFGTALTPSQQDLDNYGLTAMLALATSTIPANQAQTFVASGGDITNIQKLRLEAFGRALISTAKAMKLGLTNAAILALAPTPTSDNNFTDPHQTFNGLDPMKHGRSTTRHLALMLNAFYADLADNGDTPLDGRCVSMFYGDTPHSPAMKSVWIDSTVQGSNWMYLVSQGYVKGGWFGQPLIGSNSGGNTNEIIYGYDPVGNQPDSNFPGPNATSNALSPYGGAAAAYSVAQGDWNQVAPLYGGAKPTNLLV